MRVLQIWINGNFHHCHSSLYVCGMCQILWHWHRARFTTSCWFPPWHNQDESAGGQLHKQIVIQKHSRLTYQSLTWHEKTATYRKQLILQFVYLNFLKVFLLKNLLTRVIVNYFLRDQQPIIIQHTLKCNIMSLYFLIYGNNMCTTLKPLFDNKNNIF